MPEPGSGSKFINWTYELSKSYQSMGFDFSKGHWIKNWVVKFWSTIWWSRTIKIFKWLKILDETNDNEGLERRPGALYLVMALRHPSHGSELICGLEKGDSIVIMVPAQNWSRRLWELAKPWRKLLRWCLRVWHGTRDGGTAGPGDWVRDLDCVRAVSWSHRECQHHHQDICRPESDKSYRETVK